MPLDAPLMARAPSGLLIKNMDGRESCPELGYTSSTRVQDEVPKAMAYLTLTKDNIDSEHICCAFSDKKCAEGYALKKQWLSQEFDNGYVFRRLDERAKVFIEYGPAENAWVPVSAPNYMMVGCFWVSGRYKGNGHGKALLKEAIDDAEGPGEGRPRDGRRHQEIPLHERHEVALEAGF